MNSPYVATPSGYARKIGPKSKYGINDDGPAYGTGIGPQGAQSAMNSHQSVGSGGQKVGTPFRKTESGFATSMREARDQTEANTAWERQKAGKDAIGDSENQTKKGKDAEEKSKKEEEDAKKKKEAGGDDPPEFGLTRRMRRYKRRFTPPPSLPPSTL